MWFASLIVIFSSLTYLNLIPASISNVCLTNQFPYFLKNQPEYKRFIQSSFFRSTHCLCLFAFSHCLCHLPYSCLTLTYSSLTLAYSCLTLAYSCLTLAYSCLTLAYSCLILTYSCPTLALLTPFLISYRRRFGLPCPTSRRQPDAAYKPRKKLSAALPLARSSFKSAYMHSTDSRPS